jgi:hypothetical protein
MTRMKMRKGSSFWPNEVASGLSAITNQDICLREKFISDDCPCVSPSGVIELRTQNPYPLIPSFRRTL